MIHIETDTQKSYHSQQPQPQPQTVPGVAAAPPLYVHDKYEHVEKPPQLPSCLVNLSKTWDQEDAVIKRSYLAKVQDLTKQHEMGLLQLADKEQVALRKKRHSRKIMIERLASPSTPSSAALPSYAAPPQSFLRSYTSWFR